jgi:hypothetical protein
VVKPSSLAPDEAEYYAGRPDNRNHPSGEPLSDLQTEWRRTVIRTPRRELDVFDRAVSMGRES